MSLKRLKFTSLFINRNLNYTIVSLVANATIACDVRKKLETVHISMSIDMLIARYCDNSVVIY